MLCSQASSNVPWTGRFFPFTKLRFFLIFWASKNSKQDPQRSSMPPSVNDGFSKFSKSFHACYFLQDCMASTGKEGGTSKWLLPFYLRTNHQQGYSLYLSEEGVSFPGYTQKRWSKENTNCQQSWHIHSIYTGFKKKLPNFVFQLL